MRVCSICGRCYEDQAFSCTEEGHPALFETRHAHCDIIAGYRLDSLLESGIKGEIYRAHHTASRRSCMIKILPVDSQYSQQFLYDIDLSAALFHPNVVDVYEAGISKSGDLFVVTEDAVGQTLRDHLNTAGMPELLTSVQVIRQAAEALHAIHLKGLTHRAVSPENIILTTDVEDRLLVRVKDLDFGGVIEHSIVSNKFLIDTAIDSLRYFAPEQCSGEAVGMKSDVYSLGIVFYEMLAGVPPFDASTAAALVEKHRTQRPPEVKIDNFDLRMLITHTLMESLTKTPEKRQASANDFARQLRHIEQLATHVSTPPPAGVVPPAPARSAPPVNLAVPGPVPAFPRVFAPARATASANDASVADVPYMLSAEPIIEDFVTATENLVKEQSVLKASRLSRLRVRMKKLHQKAAQLIPENKPLPPVEAVPAMPIQMPEKTAAVPVQSLPTKIEWSQPENDIPSVADVLAALSESPATSVSMTMAAGSSIISEPHEVSVPVPEPIITSKAEPEPIIVVPPRPQARQKAVPVICEEPEEITLVSAPPRRIKVEWEAPRTPRKHAPVRKFVPQASSEVVFFPTLLGGGDRNRETAAPDTRDSFLSIYNASPSPRGFSVPHRSVLICGGVVALVVLFLFGNGFVGRYASTESSGDSVAAKLTTQGSLPQTGEIDNISPAKKKALKTPEKPLSEDDRSAAAKERRVPSIDRSQTSAAKASAAPSTPVTPPDSGKTRSKAEPEKNSASKKPLSIAENTAGATRPRIVKNPRP